jgi:hypothetical protein
MKKFALFSESHKHRLFLSRTWDVNLPISLWIMINPSLADHIADDPTVLKVISISRYNGFGSIWIINLFDYITPDQAVLATLDSNLLNDYNTSSIITLNIFNNLSPNDSVICAWGNGPTQLHTRMSTIIHWFNNSHFKRLNLKLKAVKLNSNGQPTHPLYLPENSPLIDFSLTNN